MMGVADFPMDIFKSAAEEPFQNMQDTPNQSSSKPQNSDNPAPEITVKSKRSVSPHPNGEQDDVGVSSADSSVPPTDPTGSGSEPASSDPQISLESALAAGKSVGNVVGAGMKSPMDFTLALAQGFHNAPKLYGDTTREQEKITDFQGGMKAAANVFYPFILGCLLLTMHRK